MVKRFPTLGTLVSTKTKCIQLKFIGKISLVPVVLLMAFSKFRAKVGKGAINEDVQERESIIFVRMG